jgi:hypothetical protein
MSDLTDLPPACGYEEQVGTEGGGGERVSIMDIVYNSFLENQVSFKANNHAMMRRIYRKPGRSSLTFYFYWPVGDISN